MASNDAFYAVGWASLPPELQAIIFELAADSDLEKARRLRLISRGVASWVEPRIFCEVALSSGNLRDAQEWGAHVMLRMAPEFLAAHVKRLCIQFDSVCVGDAKRILVNCTNVVNLAIWIALKNQHTRTNDSEPQAQAEPSDSQEEGGSKDVDLLIQLLLSFPSLQHLSIAEPYVEELETPGTRIPAWSATLTHLEIVYWLRDTDRQPGLLLERLQLENLTHLSLIYGYIHLYEDEPCLLSLLESRPGLQVLLIGVDDLEHVVNGNGDSIPPDDRIVYVSDRQDASRQWREENDPIIGKWALAEAEIRQRQEARRNVANSSL